MPRRDYAPLVVTGDSRWGGFLSRSSGGGRSLVCVDGDELQRGMDVNEYLDDACCVPADKDTVTNWKWVGSGKGNYMQTDKYTFVGKDGGDYDLVYPTSEPDYCSVCRGWCCCPFWVIMLVSIGFSIAFHEAMKVVAPTSGMFGRNANVAADTSTTVLFRPPKFNCVVEHLATRAALSRRGAGGGVASGDAHPAAEAVASAVATWSAEKQVWCCHNVGVGCPPRAAAAPHRGPLRFDCQAELSNWRDSWSVAKKAWCCHNIGYGCADSTTSALFDCEAGYANWKMSWPNGKKMWCCQAYGRGCPVLGSSKPFDCDLGYTHWTTSWSPEKKDWCCRHDGRGCLVERGVPVICNDHHGSATAWADQQRPETREWCCRRFGQLCHESKPYDCHSQWQSEWDAGKKAWCCIHHNLACPSTTLRPFDCHDAGPHGSAAVWGTDKKKWCCVHQGINCPSRPNSFNFDCSLYEGIPEHTWSFEKRAWCCKEYNRGCTRPLFHCAGRPDGWSIAERRWCSARHAARDHQAVIELPYDCRAGYANWERGWSLSKRAWCCEHASLGCHGDADTTTSVAIVSLPFDCSAGYRNWERGWSDNKKNWCCHTFGRGCVLATTTSNAPYDCELGYSEWQAKWSRGKKEWCCAKEDRGCPPPTTSAPYNCAASLPRHWSASKQAWCCNNEGKGCTSTTTGPLYDCEVTKTGEEIHWSVARKIWCCEHKRTGCAPPRLAAVRPILSCPAVNCFAQGAQVVRLPGAIGGGDGAAVHGLTLESCRAECASTSGCEGIIFKAASPGSLSRKSLCYGKQNLHINQCQRAKSTYLAEAIGTMPWGQCAIVGDPHILTWDRIFGPAVIQTDPGDFWLVKSEPLQVVGRFAFTDRFPNASSTIGVAVTGPMIRHHRLTVEYVGPAKGYLGFQVTWNGQRILKGFPSAFNSADGVLKARHGNFNPEDFHREGRHTIGGTDGDLPSYLFNLDQDLQVYVLLGPDNCNVIITARKIAGSQDGLCGNFNCNQEDDSMDALRVRGLAGPLPMARSLFPEPPRAPRAVGVFFGAHGQEAQD